MGRRSCHGAPLGGERPCRSPSGGGSLPRAKPVHFLSNGLLGDRLAKADGNGSGRPEQAAFSLPSFLPLAAQFMLATDQLQLGYCNGGHCQGVPNTDLLPPQRLEWDLPEEVGLVAVQSGAPERGSVGRGWVLPLGPQPLPLARITLPRKQVGDPHNSLHPENIPLGV